VPFEGPECVFLDGEEGSVLKVRDQSVVGSVFFGAFIRNFVSRTFSDLK